MTYALLRRAGLEFPLSRASRHNCHGTASKHLLSNLDNLRSVRPGALHGNTVEALPRALAPHSSLRLLPARFAKLAPRGAKFSPGGRLGPNLAPSGAGKGERARESTFIVQSRSISEMLSARFPMPLKYNDHAPRFAAGHAASLLVSVMPLDTKHYVSPEVQEVTLQSLAGAVQYFTQH